MIRPINLLAAWRSGCVCVYTAVRDTRRSVPPSICAGHKRWQHKGTAARLCVSISNHTARHLSCFSATSASSRFLPAAVGGRAAFGGKAGKLWKPLESSRSTMLRLQSADHRLLNSICTMPYGREEIAITAGEKND